MDTEIRCDLYIALIYVDCDKLKSEVGSKKRRQLINVASEAPLYLTVSATRKYK
jgi:hypothetical protein